MREFIKRTFMDGNKPSFGRQASVPFLFAACVLGFADGIHSLLRGNSALDAVATLATIAAGLYGGSKALSIQHAKVMTQVGDDGETKE